MEWYTKTRNLSVGQRFDRSLGIPDKETRRTASRHFMEKFVTKTSKTASSELIVSFPVDELKSPLNTAERLLLVQRSQKSAVGARIARARLVRGAREREATKVQSSLTQHWSFPGCSKQVEPVSIRVPSHLKRTQRAWSTPRTTHSTTELTDDHVGVWSGSSSRTVTESQPPLQFYLALIWRYLHVFQGPLGSMEVVMKVILVRLKEQTRLLVRLRWYSLLRRRQRRRL
jgi:hypothetical protein